MSDLRTLIQSKGAQQQIAAALPKHMTSDRFTRSVLTAMNKTPKLAECTQASFLNAMMTCSELGLEPNARHAHLIPYGTQCTLIVDYKGLVELAYRSERVLSISAACVYEGDKFEFDGRFRNHIPHAYLPGNGGSSEGRGLCVGAYVNIELKGGVTHQEHMSFSDIERIRNRSKAGSSGPWETDWEEMAKKTVFRRASKWIPLSSELQEAMLRDDDQVDFWHRAEPALPELPAPTPGEAIMGREEVADA